ncbi:MAG: signal peptidase I [Alphaproteobacteria bacterium]|jgi:signal peptidase I|nr:signal peptidase I [Alphaproteobacteria bacterium]
MIRNIFETLRTLFYAVLIALVVRTLFFEPFNIPSGSMKPTLLVGDYLFTSKYAYGYSKHSLPFSPPIFGGRVLEDLPERGDVVVFKLPSDGRTDYIKRVIGLPGDRIQMRDGVLHINDEAVKKERLGSFVDEAGGGRELARFVETLPNGRHYEVLDATARGPYDTTRVFEVPENHLFVMGDNRDNSMDSRTRLVGFVPIENLVGRAEVIFFSTDGTAALWELWKWPFAVRYGRLLDTIG